VDDKTIAGAQREGKLLNGFTAQYIQAFQEDCQTLNILPPTVQPRATEKIQLMLDLIAKLIEKEMAYVNDGSVYYRVGNFKDYGKLSKKNLEKNIAGASERVDQDEYESKEQVSDFVLWKGAKEGEAALGAAWDSPWGKGRPGWHIECSAMSMNELGEQFDIHAGGEDLVFPHHENEIAQSEGATGKVFVNYWLHAKHLLVNGEKMSKSKGNFFTLRDLLEKDYDPMAIRYALLSVHYRHSLNFTFEGLKEAREVIEKLDNCYFQCLSRLRLPGEKTESSFNPGILDAGLAKMEKFLGEDLNVAGALASLQEVVTAINTHLSQLSPKGLETCLDFFSRVDGLLGLDISSANTLPENVKTALEQYSEARKARDFAKSDLMRKKIVELGWLVKDGRPGDPSTVKKIRRAWDIKK
jgi:cysteinyl-tRNA synthetase